MSRKVMMQRSRDEIGMFSLATFQTLRLEALDLFDRSIAEGKPEYLERFLEVQVAQEPPPLELLSQISEDVHQRLLAIRQRHFDARDQIRRTIQHQYEIDLSLFLPSDPMQYQRLDLEDILRFVGRQYAPLSDDNYQGLSKLLQEALANAAQIHREITLADQLDAYITDWLMALHIVSVRGAWADDFGSPERLTIH